MTIRAKASPAKLVRARRLYGGRAEWSDGRPDPLACCDVMVADAVVDEDEWERRERGKAALS